MSTQGERLEELLNKKRLSQQAFGDSIGVSKSSVNKVITGKGNFELQKYITISKVYSISLDWLILGIGSMFIDTRTDEELKKRFEEISDPSAYATRDEIKKLDAKFEEFKKQMGLL